MRTMKRKMGVVLAIVYLPLCVGASSCNDLGEPAPPLPRIIPGVSIDEIHLGDNGFVKEYQLLADKFPGGSSVMAD
jgi:hypothetical protein